MFYNYLKSAWRNILKSRFFSILNIFGLSLGIAGLLLVFQFVRFEQSYDNFHEKADRTYRITFSKEKNKEEVYNTVLVFAGVGGLMKQAFPEIEEFTRLRAYVMGGIPKAPVRYGDVVFEEQRVFFADSNFFSVFSFPLIKGNRKNILKDQFTVAISESTARKYFGDQEAVGKTFRIGKYDFTVSGVFNDVPENSHVKFDFLISHSSLKVIFPPWWNDDNLQLFHGHLYVVLKPGANPEALVAKFPKFVDDYINGEQLRKTGVELKYTLMPLQDIHLNSHIQHEPEVNGDEKVVKYLTVIGLLIVIIAWINYINLSTSRALERAREVGVRKAVGAYRSHLVLQFFFESVLLNIISLGFALVLVWAGQNLFYWIGAYSVATANIWYDPYFWLCAIVVFVLGIFLSGFYPAIVLSSFKPALVLKGKFVNSKGGALLRKALVVLQFSASVSLIICTITIYRQIEYMRNRDLGFDIAKTIVVKAPLVADSTFVGKSRMFKQSLSQLAGVSGVSVSNNVPGDEPDGATWVLRAGANQDDIQFCYRAWVDEDYLADYKINLLAGRNFIENGVADSTSVIINKKCLNLFEFKTAEDAIGEKLVEDKTYTIIGVVDNFHQQSSKIEYTPIILNYVPGVRGFYSIKTQAGVSRRDLDDVQRVWNTVFPDNPFIYFLLDEEFNKQYSVDQQFGKLLSFFSALAIIIGCLGLLGLSSFMLAKRTKEIGIRKVLGSNLNQISFLLSKEFVYLIAIANAIAWPVSAYLMYRWLNNFAYRMQLDVTIFVLSACVTLFIALLTISAHVIKAASANPVKSLRTE